MAKNTQPRVIVVGGGLAGLAASVRIAESFHVSFQSCDGTFQRVLSDCHNEMITFAMRINFNAR